MILLYAILLVVSFLVFAILSLRALHFSLKKRFFISLSIFFILSLIATLIIIYAAYQLPPDAQLIEQEQQKKK